MSRSTSKSLSAPPARRRLERALLDAEFTPDDQRVWRWVAAGPTPRTVVKFELLTDQDDIRSEATVAFDGCDDLGAVNLRGTGYASRDVGIRKVHGRIGGVDHTAEINVIGLAGFLLAKAAAARSRRKPKDWYDIAYVLLHNDAGGSEAAAAAVLDRFGSEIDAFRTSLVDLRANFATPQAQGPTAYAEQLTLDHPEVDRATGEALVYRDAPTSPSRPFSSAVDQATRYEDVARVAPGRSQRAVQPGQSRARRRGAGRG